MSRAQETKREDLLASLTGFELLAGIIGNARKVDQFSSEALYDLIEELKKKYPRALGYISVRRIGDLRESEEIEQYMEFLRMGKILLSPMPNPVVQFYRVSDASRKSLLHDLGRRRVSEEQMGILKDLSQRFEEFAGSTKAGDR